MKSHSALAFVLAFLLGNFFFRSVDLAFRAGIRSGTFVGHFFFISKIS
jgi:hypothetical protein